jgi:hypothetical protein
MLWNLLGLYEKVGTWWMETVALVGERVFGATITAMPLGSGDTTFNYLEVFCLASIATAVTIVWNIADRRRLSYPRLFESLRVVVRLVVAFQMISYGSAKVLPLQFGTLLPSRLIEPVGEVSPMGMLWTFMATSAAYTFFGGASELLGGLLLVFRRTTLLGALVTAGVMTQVVMLNFCYDVPVKLLSSHLLGMAIFLALPDMKRLWDFFVLGRAITPAPVRPRFKRRWLNWSLPSATAGLFLLLTFQTLMADYSAFAASGGFSPTPRLHGVWDVVDVERDGQAISPTDPARWSAVLIQNGGFGAAIGFKPGVGPASWKMVEIVENARHMTLTDIQDTTIPSVTLTYDEPASGMLVLSGTIDGKNLRVTLRRAPPERLRLVNRGFHWINEAPFNM